MKRDRKENRKWGSRSELRGKGCEREWRGGLVKQEYWTTAALERFYIFKAISPPTMEREGGKGGGRWRWKDGRETLDGEKEKWREGRGGK